jgi:hypothetical protein
MFLEMSEVTESSGSSNGDVERVQNQKRMKIKAKQ